MSNFNYMHVCRLCHNDMRHYEGIKYGRRHYAHFACYLDADKPLSALHKWQIEGFPFKLINERGLMNEVERLTAQEDTVTAEHDHLLRPAQP